MLWRQAEQAEVQLNSFLTSALDGSEWLTSISGHFTPNIQWIGGWMGSSTSLDILEEKNVSCPSQSWTVDCLANSLVAVLTTPTLCTYCTLYTIHCTLYTVHYTLYTLHYTLYTTLYTHCTLYTVHSLYTGHYTLYTIHYTLYTVHCTLHCTLETHSKTEWWAPVQNSITECNYMLEHCRTLILSYGRAVQRLLQLSDKIFCFIFIC
jgi:hypothetical protein